MPSNHTDPVSRLYGIIGHPLSHSLSPLIHNAEFKRLDLPYAYLRWELAPEGLQFFMQALRMMKIHGLSVTIPHKQTVMGFLDHIEPSAQEIGAVNTVYLEGNTLVGRNTDMEGFLDPLMDRDLPDSALVLGAGGAARAVLAGLKRLSIDRIGVANRTRKNAAALAKECGVLLVDWEERDSFGPGLLINSTPLGMSGTLADQSPWPKECFDASMIAYDLVYNPLQTRFLREARAGGCMIIDGLSMFIGQASIQFNTWTGQDMDQLRVRSILEKVLQA